MWYKVAQKYNMFGLPLTSKPKVKQFAEEVDENGDDIENIELPIEENPIEDITPEDEITPEDVDANVAKIDNDPTAMIKLPPLHDNCHCYIETMPILSETNVNDGRRIWQKAENCCPVCEISARAFNQAEVQRLLNLGINVNSIST